jgi:hypothetical protein
VTLWFWLGVYAGGAIYHVAFILVMSRDAVEFLPLIRHALTWPFWLTKLSRSKEP